MQERKKSFWEECFYPALEDGYYPPKYRELYTALLLSKEEFEKKYTS